MNLKKWLKNKLFVYNKHIYVNFGVLFIIRYYAYYAGLTYMASFTLAKAKKNNEYIIKNIIGEDRQKRRLLDMGFTPSSLIYVSAVSPLKKAFLVNIRGNFVAIRDSAAKLIELETDYGLQNCFGGQSKRR